MYIILLTINDCHCGLEIRVSGYRSRGPGFNSQHYQIFWVVVGLESGPLSLVSTIEELFEKVVTSVYKTENMAMEICCTDHITLSIRKSWH
jgi:hypothetical protein